MLRRFAFVVLAVPAVAAGAPATLTFNERIQPIFAENCYACQGVDAGSRKAELRLDRAEFATVKRKDGGPAIVPGRPEESLLSQRIESKDEKKVMAPPEAHKTLEPEQIALLHRWIAQAGRRRREAGHDVCRDG